MEAKIIEKMGRFIELSKKFTKVEKELFDSKYVSPNYDAIHIYGSNQYILQGSGVYTPEEVLTREEKIKKELDDLITLSEEFEEFQKLRQELEDYCTSVEKLNK